MIEGQDVVWRYTFKQNGLSGKRIQIQKMKPTGHSPCQLYNSSSTPWHDYHLVQTVMQKVPLDNNTIDQHPIPQQDACFHVPAQQPDCIMPYPLFPCKVELPPNCPTVQHDSSGMHFTTDPGTDQVAALPAVAAAGSSPAVAAAPAVHRRAPAGGPHTAAAGAVAPLQ